MKEYSYLALGDSYTVGEAVQLQKSFPYEAVQLLRKIGLKFYAPEIVAKTGWTTSELQEAISEYSLLEKYDFVTLLIGVNNQYRGLSAEAYKIEFEALLNKAIQLCIRKGHVIVLSIPDYGVTPAGIALQKEHISKEIDEFNKINESISQLHNVQYINITPDSRDATTNASLVAEDKLHPSAKEYRKWAEKLAEKIIEILKS